MSVHEDSSEGFTLFVGFMIWAWSGKRKQEFEVLARLPPEDDKSVVPVSKFGVPAVTTGHV